MHGYCSTCINILVFFPLSLFLSFSLVLSAHSPSRFTLRDQHHDCCTKNSIDQHHMTVADQHHSTAVDQHQTTRRLIKSPPITLPLISVFLIWSRSNHCRRWTRWSRSNHYRRSTSNHCHTSPDQIAAGQLTDFSLVDRWVSGWVGDDLAFELSGFRPKWVSDLVVWSWMVF